MKYRELAESGASTSEIQSFLTESEPYAVALDQAETVKVFAKLPSKFKIDTPLGSYNPDWAYVEEVQGRERVYFVMETKGKARGTNRPTEEAKIDCAEKRFEALGLGPNFKYDVEVEYHYAVI
jgi:type III restriction enzyme